MGSQSLGAALEREHREIDGGIEEFTANQANGRQAVEPLVRAMTGLRRHIYLEEEFLFPPLREAGMMMPIFVMLREHGELWNTMDAVEALLEKDNDPEATVNACRELLAQLDQHNSKEEPIIYPQADKVLTAEASSGLSAFLADGRMPAGWVCSAVRPK
ncbi:MAG TPA: hemerythrin domain-containing protein [Terrimesophilobacter sp.]|uniref:hemerythrin domain-containing protein n=1 Tax=Terrimesophilobacter sp. TaxID=2906435 RepID=UPI002F947379